MPGSQIQTDTNNAIATHENATAIGTLFEGCRPRLYAHALRICGNTPLAEDAVQETFISAFIHYRSLKKQDAFYPWVKRILFNHCFRMLSKEKHHSLPVAALSDTAMGFYVEEHFESTANCQQVYKALEQLSDELRSCVMLRFFSNFSSYEEIATILAIPVGTVRSRLSAARKKLFNYFRQYGDSNDKALKESQKWNDYYSHLWANLYFGHKERKELFAHMHPALNIRFTSGKTARGRDLIVNEVYEDLEHGSFFKVDEIVTSGNITLVQGGTFNSPEFPDRCPPSSIFVLFRGKSQVETFHIFDSPRSNH